MPIARRTGLGTRGAFARGNAWRGKRVQRRCALMRDKGRFCVEQALLAAWLADLHEGNGSQTHSKASGRAEWVRPMRSSAGSAGMDGRNAVPGYGELLGPGGGKEPFAQITSAAMRCAHPQPRAEIAAAGVGASPAKPFFRKTTILQQKRAMSAKRRRTAARLYPSR